MSIYSKLMTGTASMVGGFVAQATLPPFVAPAARSAAQATMTWMWGASKGFIDTTIRKGIAEHVGHKAFEYAIPASNLVGSVATVAAIEGGKLLVGYANHVIKNQVFLNGVKKAGTEITVDRDLHTFEMDSKEPEGFKLG